MTCICICMPSPPDRTARMILYSSDDCWSYMTHMAITCRYEFATWCREYGDQPSAVVECQQLNKRKNPYKNMNACPSVTVGVAVARDVMSSFRMTRQLITTTRIGSGDARDVHHDVHVSMFDSCEMWIANITSK